MSSLYINPVHCFIFQKLTTTLKAPNGAVNLGIKSPKNILSFYSNRSFTRFRISATLPQLLPHIPTGEPYQLAALRKLTSFPINLMPTTTLSTAQATATGRTLHIWFLSNLGGTAWLVFDFCHDSMADVAVPLIIGLMAALLSLATVPVFFSK